MEYINFKLASTRHKFERIDKKRIKKTLSKNIPPKYYLDENNLWLDTYKKVRALCPFLIEVYKRNGPEYIIEDVGKHITVDNLIKDSHPKLPITKNIICDIHQALAQLMSAQMQVSRQLGKNQYFIHEDVSIQNLVVTENSQVKIIDVDSFCFGNHIGGEMNYAFANTDLIYKLQKHFKMED